jgi:hypothetical protein
MMSPSLVATGFQQKRTVYEKQPNLMTMDFQPHGIYVLQSWAQVGLILRAIDQYNVDLFVEVGVARGGLQQFITPRTFFVEDFNYLGCDTDEKNLPKLLWQRNVYTFIGDCFREGFASILEIAIQRSKRAFIFCDGGYKAKEIGYFRQFLRSGDLLATHDFTDEVAEEDLACLKSEWDEMEPELYRRELLPLFRKR